MHGRGNNGLSTGAAETGRAPELIGQSAWPNMQLLVSVRDHVSKHMLDKAVQYFSLEVWGSWVHEHPSLAQELLAAGRFLGRKSGFMSVVLGTLYTWVDGHECLGSANWNQ